MTPPEHKIGSAMKAATLSAPVCRIMFSRSATFSFRKSLIV